MKWFWICHHIASEWNLIWIKDWDEEARSSENRHLVMQGGVQLDKKGWRKENNGRGRIKSPDFIVWITRLSYQSSDPDWEIHHESWVSDSHINATSFTESTYHELPCFHKEEEEANSSSESPSVVTLFIYYLSFLYLQPLIPLILTVICQISFS